MAPKINKAEHKRRHRCMRQWYFSYKDCARRSAERRRVIATLGINSDNFYKMLEGRTYISDTSVQVINKVINRNCIPGLEIDIFAE